MSTLASQPKPRRRWFRFSLRTLLILVAVSCVWLGWQVHWIRQRHEFLASGKFFLIGPDWDGRTPLTTRTSAPGGLWLFGEEGVYGVDIDGQWEPTAHQALVERARALFPEAEILDSTYSRHD